MPETPDTMTQTAPYPTILASLVERLRYRPGWRFGLVDLDRGQGSEGLTLDVITLGYDTYQPERGENYRVHHYFIVPAASYNEQSWRRWIFERLLEVERHEAAEFFVIGTDRPYAPIHAPGWDPYIVFDYGDEEAVRTRFDGTVAETGRDGAALGAVAEGDAVE